MKWGIWNSNTKRFCFGIQASSRAEAEMQFYQRAPGKAGYLWRYEAKRIPEGWKNPPNPNWPKQRRDTA